MVLFGAIVIIAGIMIAKKSLLQQANINEIGVTSTSNSARCRSGLATFNAKNSCGNTGFTTYSYTCQNGQSGTVGEGTKCVGVAHAYEMAMRACGNRCVVTSSAKPVPSPVKPVASCRPRPACLDSVPQCKIAVTEDMCPPSPQLSPVPAPSGCYYQQVQCVKAPCEPVLICADARPNPVICRNECVWRGLQQACTQVCLDKVTQ